MSNVSEDTQKEGKRENN